MITVRFRRVRPAEDLPDPARATAGSAGVDLAADVPADAPVTLEPGAHARIPTGLALEIPPGHEGQVRPRSGLAAHHGVTVLNSPGTVDADYRGEVQVILVNLGSEPHTVTRGARVAQLVVAEVPASRWLRAGDLDATERGEGGFGSTGS